MAGDEQEGARVLGDEDSILALTRLPFSGRAPEVREGPGRLALKRQLGGELSSAASSCAPPSVLRLLRLLAA